MWIWKVSFKFLNFYTSVLSLILNYHTTYILLQYSVFVSIGAATAKTGDIKKFVYGKIGDLTILNLNYLH